MRVPPRTVTRPESSFEPAGKNLHEGGLAVAVAADNADAVAFVQTDRDAFKDGSGREFEMQRFAAK